MHPLGLVEVPREEGSEAAVSRFLWDPTGWDHDHGPVPSEEQGHRGAQAHRPGDVGEDGQRIMCAVLREGTSGR